MDLRRRASVAAFAFLVLALSGCATTPSSPAGAENAPDDPATWVLDETHFGPIELGVPIAEALAAVPDLEFTDLGSSGFAGHDYHLVVEADGVPGFIEILTGSTGDVMVVELYVGQRGHRGVELVPEPAVQVVLEQFPRTVEGISIGATLEEAQAAYPDGAFLDGMTKGDFATDGEPGRGADPGLSLVISDFDPASSDIFVNIIRVTAQDTTTLFDES
ncbi:hypothetical protein [Microbacterium rhizophilus]|uniref:hypothetical protein n=1 Tax=Microbacterium rhizophilus TaxID=3138934 RepID=UPI0031EF8313